MLQTWVFSTFYRVRQRIPCQGGAARAWSGARRISIGSLQLLLLAGALASALTADTIVYDNIDQSSAGADSVDFVGPLDDSFTSGAAGQITDLQLMLSGDQTSSGSVDVGLYGDNSTTPGELIAVLGIVYDSALSDTPAIYDIALTAFPLLTDDTLYWVGLSGTTTAAWAYDYDESGIGVADEFFSNQIGVFSNDNDPYQMSVTEGVSTVPEPSTCLLIVVGIGVLALLRRRVTFARKALRIPEITSPRETVAGYESYTGVCPLTYRPTCLVMDAPSAAEAVKVFFFALNKATKWSRTGIRS